MVLSETEIREQVKAELRNALAYFIERQKLVAQAMSELGLDLYEVGEFGPIAWMWNPQSDDINYRDVVNKQIENSADSRLQKMLQLALRSNERKLPQSGIWHDNENNEWRYFLHGSGCRLTNVNTGEPIDWDCPDVNNYDAWKFMFHLIWQLSSSNRARYLVSTLTWVGASLDKILNEIQNENL